MKPSRREFIKKSTLTGIGASLVSIPFSAFSGTQAEMIKIGIIGLDTSHAPAFAKLFNAENPTPELAGFKVVAAFP